MKLVVNYYEAQDIIAASHQLPAASVEITPADSSNLNGVTQPDLRSVIHDPKIREAIAIIFNEGYVFKAGGTRNLISLVKAIRTLTHCGLKEGKEFADELTSPF